MLPAWPRDEPLAPVDNPDPGAFSRGRDCDHGGHLELGVQAHGVSRPLLPLAREYTDVRGTGSDFCFILNDSINKMQEYSKNFALPC